MLTGTNNIMKVKTTGFLTVIFLLGAIQTVFAQKLTIERIYSSPALSGAAIQGLQISPDGKRVTFLKGKKNDYQKLDLWEYNLKTGKSHLLVDSSKLQPGKVQLSDEEKNRRERMRQKNSGIIRYQWSHDSKALLFPLAGDAFYYRLSDKKAQRLFKTAEFETDVRFSPKGHYVSFIRNQNLFIYDLARGQERQLTHGKKKTIKYGMAEFVAQEEMDRDTGYWWSEDDSKLAFTKVDESVVDEVSRSEIYADNIKIVKQRYPYAGTANVRISLYVLDLKSHQIKKVDLGKEQDFYLARVKWSRNNQLLSYQWQSRDQKVLKLGLYDWQKNHSKILIEEKSPTWINLNHDLYFLKNGQEFIWKSERSGYAHLYLYDLKGHLKNAITKGQWEVDALKFVDEKHDKIYFTGRKKSATEKHLYTVDFSGNHIKQITQESGFHNIVFAKKEAIYLDYFSSIKQPPQVSLIKSSGQLLSWINRNQVDKNHPMFPYLNDWIYPELSSFKTAQGVELFYRLYKPTDFNPNKKYPVFVYLYGGPGAQLVTNRWGNYFPEYMAQRGYVVFTLDNRGSAHRGKKFEDAIYHHMGEVEIQDQIEGVKFLRKFPWVDAERVAVHGHSYGGFMTLMALFKASDYFKAGVAGAPVTDWHLYDTHYTERYLGNPAVDDNPYQISSVFPYAANLKSPLLIYHGMADDNVLFKNSTRLYKFFQDHNIPFSMMDYPGKKHGIRGKKTSMHRLHLIENFINQIFKK